MSQEMNRERVADESAQRQIKRAQQVKFVSTSGVRGPEIEKLRGEISFGSSESADRFIRPKKTEQVSNKRLSFSSVSSNY